MRHLLLLLVMLTVIACAATQKPVSSAPVTEEKILALPGVPYVIALALPDAGHWRTSDPIGKADPSRIVLVDDRRDARIEISGGPWDGDMEGAAVALEDTLQHNKFDVAPCDIDVNTALFSVSAAVCAEKRHRAISRDGKEVLLMFREMPRMLVSIGGVWNRGDDSALRTFNALFQSATPVRASVMRTSR